MPVRITVAWKGVPPLLYKTIALALAFVVLSSASWAGARATPQSDDGQQQLHLRRGVFDPLAKAAPLVSPGTAELMLVQLEAPPDEQTPALLEAAGFRPLWYVPDNAFLVRAVRAQGLAKAQALPDVRWVGSFDITYKISPELDTLLTSAAADPAELSVVVAPDADASPAAELVVKQGGAVLDRAAGLNGTTLRVRLTPAVLRELVAREDILWVEPYLPAATLDDQARQILGVPEVRSRLGLTGAGQTIAVTDTGLDVQGSLSADFTGRVLRGFTRREMYAGCAALPESSEPGTWSDLHGHGTHVAGMIAGMGRLSSGRFGGVAPGATLVVQSVSSGGDALDCLPAAATYLQAAYDAGARIHNGSFGRKTGSGSCEYGCYTSEDAVVDDFLWRYKDYLFVVAAGNSGRDTAPPYGVVDSDSISSPATAKNVLSVGASENSRPGTGGCSGGIPEQICWSYYDSQNIFGLANPPLGSDPISNNSSGMAAFSSRGPTDDGRIKPELVAPGTNIISARTHQSGVQYIHGYGADYAYLSGTSMATPQVSGMAALARQWLAKERLHIAPSAALVKALLLNGGVSLRPGQYAGVAEIPDEWPNAVEGWGRAAIGSTVGVGADDQVWLAQHTGLRTAELAEYTVSVSAGAPLRVTLTWTDYPAAPGVAKALVNDLDLQVIAPDGSVLLGNRSASIPATCRSSGADRCNTAESIELAAPVAGSYIIRVRGLSVPRGPQPFALAARAGRILDLSVGTPLLRPIAGPGPALQLSWTPSTGASYYRVEVSSSGNFSGGVLSQIVTSPALGLIEDVGTHYVRVRACTASGCGEYSNVQAVSVTVSPRQMFLPSVQG
ncbi:MAG: hypothetical protein RLZZ387_2733 [Chloroflexota bacterium]